MHKRIPMLGRSDLQVRYQWSLESLQDTRNDKIDHFYFNDSNANSWINLTLDLKCARLDNRAWAQAGNLPAWRSDYQKLS